MSPKFETMETRPRPTPERISELAKDYAEHANSDALLDILAMSRGMNPADVDAGFLGWEKDDFRRLFEESLGLITKELRDRREGRL